MWNLLWSLICSAWLSLGYCDCYCFSGCYLYAGLWLETRYLHIVRRPYLRNQVPNPNPIKTRRPMQVPHLHYPNSQSALVTRDILRVLLWHVIWIWVFVFKNLSRLLVFVVVTFIERVLWHTSVAGPSRLVTFSNGHMSYGHWTGLCM